jgi:2-polyprenyl-3-methyl-5-hydroxy-6-metoxy-1,4-benzoquinol methylase
MITDVYINDILAKLNKTISQDDVMYLHNCNIDHYLWCGESALKILLATISLAEAKPPETVLDFGAGAGRVSRWLTAALPNSKIHACDVRDQDMEFLRSSLGIEAWTIGTNIHTLTLPGRYDLVWAGSVVTHLRESDSRQLIDKLLSYCKPGGLLVLSFHGRRAIENGAAPYAIGVNAWHQVERDYFDKGYGYADYEGQVGYGISVCSSSWMLNLFRETSGLRLVLLSETAWANHHDIVAVQRIAS